MMKKILAFLLVVALAFSVAALTACQKDSANGDNTEINAGSNAQNGTADGGANAGSGSGYVGSSTAAFALEDISRMFEVGEPKRSEATTVQDSGETVISSSYVLTVGFVDGKAAAVLETKEMRMRTVEDSGDSKVVLSPIEEKTEIKEYVDGLGVRTDGGRWKTGESFIPERGSVTMNLDAELIENVKLENNVLSFTVKAENAAAVLGVEGTVEGDVSVVVTTDGTRVIAVAIDYTVAADDEVFLDETEISIDVAYSYDYQNITID